MCFTYSRDFIKRQKAHFFCAGCVLRSKKTHLASVRIYARSAFYVTGKNFHASAWQGLSYDIKKVPSIRNFFISWKWDLNPRPTHYECVALPTELIQQIFFFQPTKLLYIISFYLASVFFIKMIYDDIAPVFQIHVQKTRAIFSHIVSVQSQAKFHKTDVKCLHF